MKTCLKVIIISLSFYVIVPLAFMTYFGGAPFDIVVFFVAAPIAFLIIGLASDRWWMVPLFGTNFAAAYLLHVALSTRLYYDNISSDELTPPIGMLVAFAGAFIALAVTAIMTVVKVIVHRKETRRS